MESGARIRHLQIEPGSSPVAHAGLAYGGLYMRSGTLWSPILAHAVTNLMLGVWVVATASWSFW
jgi:membrane protease YdiL (CAAX protease family)